MGVKNSEVHFMLETSFKDKLKLTAFEEGVTISELCRQRMKEQPRLQRIELMLERLLKRR